MTFDECVERSAHRRAVQFSFDAERHEAQSGKAKGRPTVAECGLEVRLLDVRGACRVDRRSCGGAARGVRRRPRGERSWSGVPLVDESECDHDTTFREGEIRRDTGRCAGGASASFTREGKHPAGRLFGKSTKMRGISVSELKVRQDCGVAQRCDLPSDKYCGGRIQALRCPHNVRNGRCSTDTACVMRPFRP